MSVPTTYKYNNSTDRYVGDADHYFFRTSDGKWHFNFLTSDGSTVVATGTSVVTHPFNTTYEKIANDSSKTDSDPNMSFTFSNTSSVSTLFNSNDHTSPGGDGIIPDVFHELEKAHIENVRDNQIKMTHLPHQFEQGKQFFTSFADPTAFRPNYNYNHPSPYAGYTSMADIWNSNGYYLRDDLVSQSIPDIPVNTRAFQGSGVKIGNMT